MAPAIQEFMTPLVHTVRVGAKFSEAHALMREHLIRHLLVLNGKALVGVISDRDLYLLEALGAGNASEISVEEAMQPVLVVPPEMLLYDVARLMTAGKLGSAVVAREENVLGIFTAMDGLRALAGCANPDGVVAHG